MKYIFLLLTFLPVCLFAYPNEEATVVNIGLTDTVTDFIKISDQRAVVSLGEDIKLINLANFALEEVQPPTPEDTDEDGDIPGNITSIAYDSFTQYVYASQDDGDLIYFDLKDVEKKASRIIISEGVVLGPIAINTGNSYIAIGNSEDKLVYILETGSDTPTPVSVTIPNTGQYNFTDVVFANSKFFFTTDKGAIAVIDPSNNTSTIITVDILTPADLTSIGTYPNEDFLYVTDKTNGGIVKINSSTQDVIKDASDIPVTFNKDYTSTIVTKINNAGTEQTYSYVAGALGISVINASTDAVLNMDTEKSADKNPISTSATPSLLIASSKTDGYVYSINAVSTLGIITSNPWLTVVSLEYTDDKDYLATSNEATLVFKSDMDGTYELRVGGDVSGDGELLKNTEGKSSGTLKTNEEISFTFNYENNAVNFIEGDNDVFIFATNTESDRGRILQTVKVDTPPPKPAILKTGFGNESAYLTINRLDVEDMSYYNVYTDTDPEDVMTKSKVALKVNQSESGDIVAKVSGLKNDTLYYLAVEAVDLGKNISTRNNKLKNGSVAKATPTLTMGPAMFCGEVDCNLNTLEKNPFSTLLIIFSTIIILLMKKKKTFICVFLFLLLISSSLYAQESTEYVRKESEQMWSFEVKTGFWLPQDEILESFFGKCCNLITKMQGGFLYKRKYGIEIGAGFFTKAGSARSVNTGKTSEDRYRFIMVPLELDVVWRADYFSWRYLVPYLKGGVDYVYFRESVGGRSINNWKYGCHGTGGLQINLGEVADIRHTLDDEMGINDFFLIMESSYQWINDFGVKNMDLSGWVFSAGFLFEF